MQSKLSARAAKCRGEYFYVEWLSRSPLRRAVARLTSFPARICDYFHVMLTPVTFIYNAPASPQPIGWRWLLARCHRRQRSSIFSLSPSVPWVTSSLSSSALQVGRGHCVASVVRFLHFCELVGKLVDQGFSCSSLPVNSLDIRRPSSSALRVERGHCTACDGCSGNICCWLKCLMPN